MRGPEGAALLGGEACCGAGGWGGGRPHLHLEAGQNQLTILTQTGPTCCVTLNGGQETCPTVGSCDFSALPSLATLRFRAILPWKF